MSEDLKYRTTIQTEHLLLKPLSLADADDIFHIRSFREIYQWTIAGQWTLKSQATEWVNAILSNPTAYNFTITLLPSPDADPTVKPVVIGSIGFARDDEIGYLFHPGYWGRGYATEAVAAFVKTYFEKLPDAKFVIAKTDVTNKGSMRVLEKVGFAPVGEEVFDNPTMGLSPAVVFEMKRPGTVGDGKSTEDKS